MRNTDLYDQRNWYPIIVDPNISDATTFDYITRIVNAYIRLDFLARNLDAYADEYPIGDIVLTRIFMNNSKYFAEIKIYGNIFENGFTTINAPIYSDINIYPDYDHSYIIMVRKDDGQLHIESRTLNIKLHPDCLSIVQRPPELKFGIRNAVSIDDGITSEGHWSSEYVNTHMFGDGNNVAVTYINGGIMFTGGSDLGKGVYTEPPYVNPTTSTLEYADELCARGLRSINGKTNDVSILGTEDIVVSQNITGNVVTLSVNKRT